VSADLISEPTQKRDNLLFSEDDESRIELSAHSPTRQLDVFISKENKNKQFRNHKQGSGA
jgi:hypothetical protein